MRFLGLALALVSMPVLACPNLAGVYKTCTSSTHQSTEPLSVSVTQQVVRKATEYAVSTTDEHSDGPVTEYYRADGKTVTRVQSDSNLNIKTETTASCQGENLNVNMKVSMDTQVIGTVDVKIYKAGNKLVQEISGDTFGENLKDTITCE